MDGGLCAIHGLALVKEADAEEAGKTTDTAQPETTTEAQGSSSRRRRPLRQVFFREEYALNHMIATLKTPFISILDGITSKRPHLLPFSPLP